MDPRTTEQTETPQALDCLQPARDAAHRAGLALACPIVAGLAGVTQDGSAVAVPAGWRSRVRTLATLAGSPVLRLQDGSAALVLDAHRTDAGTRDTETAWAVVLVTDPTEAERAAGAVAVVLVGIALHVLYSTDAREPIRFGRTLDQARRRVQTRHPVRALVRSAVRDGSADCPASLCAPAPAGDFADFAPEGSAPEGH